MPETNLRKSLMAIAEVLNVLSKITNGSSILVAFSLSDELGALQDFDAAQLKAELAALDDAAKDEHIAAFKEKLVLQNKEMEAKIEGSVDILDDGIEIVMDGLELVKKAKALLS